MMINQNPSNHKTFKVIVRSTLSLILGICVGVGSVGTIPVSASSAAALTPSTWQTSSVGLKTSQNSAKETGGLGFNVFAPSWPSLQLRGGVESASDSFVKPTLDGPVGIDLGLVSVTGAASPSLTGEATDWSHDQMTFNYSGTAFQTWVSRLSPAVAFESSASGINLFSGNVNKYSFNGTTISGPSSGTSSPKYAAYSQGGAVRVQILGSGNTAISPDQNWILVWYGNNSHFVDSKRPLTYARTILQSQAYQADAPILMVFGNRPTGIKQGSSGGISLTFTGAAGAFAVMPLYGRDTRLTSETEGWSSSLPTAVQQKASLWSSYLCSFPTSATESYAYDGPSDRASMTETIARLNICSGTKFAPIAPMVALATSSLGITYSGTVKDGGVATEFGPSMGIEGTDQYTWSVSGLGTYLDHNRSTGSGTAPAEMETKLQSTVDKIIASGHYAPWIFLDAVPVQMARGDLYWDNPADELLPMIEAAEALSGSDTARKNSLISVIRNERTNFPPETVYNLDVTQGKIRFPFTFFNNDVLYYFNPNTTANDARQDAFLKNVPIYSFYALARYYNLTGDAITSSVWPSALSALDRNMREQDWATGYWFNGYQDRAVAVTNANRQFDGLVGFVKLAKSVGDSANESLGRALFAKAAVLRAGMAVYPRYLYSAGLVQLPNDPAWLEHYGTDPYVGYLYNYNWSGPYDDPRQMAYMDQFGTNLNDYNGNMIEDPYLIAFKDMAPELGRFLGDKVNADVQAPINKLTALTPHWYAAYNEGTLGWEHNLSHPDDSFNIFMAKSWIQGATADQLAHYVDIPWLTDGGDFFYLQKLAETVKQFRGEKWGNSVNLFFRPGNQTIFLTWTTPATVPGNWTISASPADGGTPIQVPGSARSATLSGMQNYLMYTVWISGVDDSGGTIQNSIQAFATDRLLFLPVIRK